MSGFYNRNSLQIDLYHVSYLTCSLNTNLGVHIYNFLEISQNVPINYLEVIILALKLNIHPPQMHYK